MSDEQIKQKAIEYCERRPINECSFNPITVNDLVAFAKNCIEDNAHNGTLVIKDVRLSQEAIEELNKPQPIVAIPKSTLKPTKVNAFEQMTFDVNTPQFLKEAAENCNGGMYSICWNLFRQLLAAVAQRATELQDPVLDALMIKLNLYEMPNSERRKMIKILEQNYKEQIYVGNTKHSNSEN